MQARFGDDQAGCRPVRGLVGRVAGSFPASGRARLQRAQSTSSKGGAIVEMKVAGRRALPLPVGGSSFGYPRRRLAVHVVEFRLRARRLL